MLSCGISKHPWWLLPMYNFFSIRDLNYSRNLEILEMYNIIFKSSRPEMFCKKDVLKNLAKFTGNTCARVFFFKKRLWHRCFSVNFAKFLRTPFFIEHLWRLLREKNNVKVISCDFVNY